MSIMPTNWQVPRREKNPRYITMPDGTVVDMESDDVMYGFGAQSEKEAGFGAPSEKELRQRQIEPDAPSRPGLLPDWQFYKDVGNTLKKGVLDPKFYKGAAKEMTAGLLGLPGDVGFAIGNAPAVIDNWREGRPLDTNVGRMSDYRLTAEGLADTFGIGFEGGGAEDAGRVLGGLVNVGGLLKGGARILQKAGETVGKSRSGPGKYEQGNVGVVDITPIDELWGKDVDPSIFVGGTTGRGLSGGKTPFAENPTPADMQKLMEDGTTQFRIIKDVDGNVYVYDSSAGVHQQFIDGWEDWTGKTFEVDHDFWNSVSEREFNADEVLKIMEDPAADPNFQAMNAVSGRWRTPEPDNFTESEMAVLRDIGARQQPADPAEMITKSEFQRLEADIPPDNNIDVSGTDYTELTPSERRVFDEAMRQFDEMNPGLLNKGVGGRQRGAAQGSGIGRQRGVGGEGGEVPKAIKDVVEQVSRNVDSGLLADSDPVQSTPGLLRKSARGKPPRMTRAEAERAGLWHDIGAGKRLPKPVSEMSRETVPYGDVKPHRELNPEELQGKTLIPALGDRTDIGHGLLSVGGKPLREPVKLEGGHGYMREGDESVWASGKGMVTRLNKLTRETLDEGGDPALVYLPAGHGATDFSAMMSDSLLEQMRAGNISAKAKRDFDKAMRVKRPEWKGIDHPDAIKQLDDVGEVRRAFVETAKLDQFKNRPGFPDIAETRFAITDPALMDTPLLHGGQSIARPSGELIDNPAVPHRSYPHQMGGEYLGGIEQGLPADVLFPDFHAARRAAGAPKSADYRSMDLSKPRQKATQQWLDGVMAYLKEHGRLPSYAVGLLGGAGISAEDLYEMEGA